MANSHSAYQFPDRVLIEYISDHAIGLALIETTLRSASDDPAGILASMLQQRKTFADLWSTIDIRIVQKQA